MSLKQIALVGNPNCGKTLLFNKLTGSRQHVGNWPGVTVDKKEGYYHYQKQRIEVVDLPGTYAIENDHHPVSQDEQVVRQFVLQDEESLIVNIIDASNLQRSLYLTSQLLDLHRPMIVVLNMIDVLEKSGEQIDVPRLSEQLGCPVIAISAKRNKNIAALLSIIHDNLQQPMVSDRPVMLLAPPQADIIQQFLAGLPATSAIHQQNRWQLLQLIQENNNTTTLTADEQRAIQSCQEALAHFCGGELDIVLASSRYEAIDQLTRQVLVQPREASVSLTNRLDKWALGRVTGIPIFFAVMYLMFMLAINLGAALTDFFDTLMGTLFVDGTRYWLARMMAPEWLIALLADGVGNGIQTVSTFIPVIGAMFLFLSFLEDSGYLARAAVIVDRGMRAIGLPGKAFVPMLVGFGCNVPAIMGTRVLENNRDRLMSIMMIPFMSCGARLPVYALFAAVFFPRNGQNIVFLLYFIGIIVAIVTGFALKFSLLPGKATPFIMELPAYRMPTMRNLFALTWEKLKSFIFRAGKAIVLMVMALSLLNSLGKDGTFGHSNSDHSVLVSLSKNITPIFSPMGIQQQNWPATVGIFTGVFAKEAVIGSLNSLYASIGSDEKVTEDQEYNAWKGIKAAFETIPENIAGLADALTDPLNIRSKLAEGDIETIKANEEIDDNTIRQMHLAFGNSHAAIAYLIFILLYTPCAAALGAVYREAGIKWMAIVATWTFVIGWICATGYYQMTLLSSMPEQALLWLTGLTAVLVILFLGLRWIGRYSHIDLTLARLPVSKNKSNYSRGCH